MPETGSVWGESVHLRVILPLVNSTIDKEESMPGPDYAWEESAYLRLFPWAVLTPRNLSSPRRVMPGIGVFFHSLAFLWTLYHQDSAKVK